MGYCEYDKKTLDKLHKVHLEILDEFVRICNKNKLNYSLVGGTLLGAVRHSGFIPWDDDVDVIMPRDDYDKFLKIADKELDSKYYLDCFEKNKNYHLLFAKLKKNNTIFDEKAAHHLDEHKGIFIDIFPSDYLYDNVKRSYYDAVITRIISNTISVKYKLNKIRKTRHPIMVSILYILPKNILKKLQNKIITKNKNKNYKYMACFLGDYPFMYEVMKKEDFFPLIDIEFEGKKYKAMHNYEVYLKNMYGDYMKLPPKDKRVNHMPLKIDFGESDEN